MVWPSPPLISVNQREAPSLDRATRTITAASATANSRQNDQRGAWRGFKVCARWPGRMRKHSMSEAAITARTTTGKTDTICPKVEPMTRIGPNEAAVVIIAAVTGVTIRPAPFSAAS